MLNKTKSHFFLLILPLLLTACTEKYLSVHTDYISRETLASYYVNTPDPRLNNPSIGQRLIISWSMPKEYLDYEDLHLDLYIRFRNREETTESLGILKRKGTYIYELLNEEYIQKQGILTYKMDLIGNGQVLEEWRHQIWTDLLNRGACQEN